MTEASAPEQTPTPEQTPAPEQAATEQTPAPDVAALAAQVETLTSQLAAAKQSAADEREHSIVQTLLKALGRGEDGEKVVSTEDLARQLSESQAKAKDLEAREVVRSILAKDSMKDVDAGRLFKHSDFLTELAKVDATDHKAVEALISSTTTEYPWLKTTVQATGRSGTDLTGGTGEAAITKDKFSKMTGDELNALAASDPATFARLLSE